MTMNTNNIQREIHKLYAFEACWMFLAFIPILVTYQLSLGLSMQEIFWLQVIFGLVSALCEVPSGYMCDLFGRKKSLVAGAILWGLGFSYLNWAHTFWQWVLFETFLGVAVSLVSGSDMAMLYDWLKLKQADEADSSHTLANYQMTQVSSEAMAGIAGGLLVLWSYQHVIWLQMGIGWLPLLVAYQLREPTYEKMSRQSHRDNLKLVWTHVFRKDPLIRLVFVNQIAWSMATFVAVWIYQKYWQDQGISLAFFGLIWAGYNLLVGLVGQQVYRWEHTYGSTVLLISLALLPVVGYGGMAVLTGWAGVAMGLLFCISRGITQIILRDALNRRTPGAYRATVLSMVNMGFRLSFAIIGPLTGWAIDHLGLEVTFQCLALVFLAMFVVTMWPLLRQVHEIQQEMVSAVARPWKYKPLRRLW